mgnify:CR=1 FL=1
MSREPLLFEKIHVKFFNLKFIRFKLQKRYLIIYEVHSNIKKLFSFVSKVLLFFDKARRKFSQKLKLFNWDTPEFICEEKSPTNPTLFPNLDFQLNFAEIKSLPNGIKGEIKIDVLMKKILYTRKTRKAPFPFQ